LPFYTSDSWDQELGFLNRHLPAALFVTPAPNGRNEVIDALVLQPKPAKSSCPGEVQRPDPLLLCERLDIKSLEEVISRSVVDIQFLLCHFDSSSPRSSKLLYGRFGRLNECMRILHRGHRKNTMTEIQNVTVAAAGPYDLASFLSDDLGR
jgi:hypothetical protein